MLSCNDTRLDKDVDSNSELTDASSKMNPTIQLGTMGNGGHIQACTYVCGCTCECIHACTYVWMYTCFTGLCYV